MKSMHRSYRLSRDFEDNKFKVVKITKKVIFLREYGGALGNKLNLAFVRSFIKERRLFLHPEESLLRDHV